MSLLNQIGSYDTARHSSGEEGRVINITNTTSGELRITIEMRDAQGFHLGSITDHANEFERVLPQEPK